MLILIAEDERITRRKLQRQLEAWGHEVVATEDGQQAWEQFGERSFDLVITDWDMPRMDGRALIEKIRDETRAVYAYVIMLTGRSDTSDLVAGLDAGADDYVAKPFDKSELRARVRAGERIVELERSLAQRNADLLHANERMERDLASAARMQQGLLPKRPPNDSDLTFAWHYRPCDELAGDLLNAMALDGDRVALYVVDVSGHGVSSSLVAVSVHRSLSPRRDGASLVLGSDEEGADSSVDPADVVTRLNDVYPMASNGGHFMTVCFGVVDRARARFDYACAGHPSPVLARRGQPARDFDIRSFPIGVVDEAGYELDGFDLEPGDRVYLFSDGVTEAADGSLQEFGVEGIRRVVDATRAGSLQESVEAIVEAAAGFHGSESFDDDLSVIAFEYAGR